MDDPLADRARAKEKAYIPPPVNGDFYRIADLLDPKERAVVKRVRDFMEAEVAPIIGDFWARDQWLRDQTNSRKLKVEPTRRLP
jgi:glutaryl-CoA dehydrogenase